jgi:ribosome-associated toxin RatA of RatAB toxin-antitoxin module
MGALLPRIAGLLALLLLAPVRSAWAEGPASKAAPSPTVEATHKDGVFVVKGSFEVAAPRDVVWGVLTDYEGMPRFIPSVRRSVVRINRPDMVVVEQEAVETALFISGAMRVLLRIREQEDQLSFRDVSQRDFRIYEGAWQVEPVQGGGCRVTYTLRADPLIPVPGFLATSTFKGAGTRLLTQLRAEMLRRAQTTNP